MTLYAVVILTGLLAYLTLDTIVSVRRHIREGGDRDRVNLRVMTFTLVAASLVTSIALTVRA